MRVAIEVTHRRVVRIVDISCRGLLVESPAELFPGKPVHFEVPLYDGEVETVRARVIHCRQAPRRAGAFLVGCLVDDDGTEAAMRRIIDDITTADAYRPANERVGNGFVRQ